MFRRIILSFFHNLTKKGHYYHAKNKPKRAEFYYKTAEIIYRFALRNTR